MTAVADRHVRADACVYGVAAALTSASLAMAAHGAAGGDLPSSGQAVLIAGIAAGVGWLWSGASASVAASAAGRPRPTASSTSILLVTQVLGHLVLAGGPGHAHGLIPSPAMLGAHVAAVVVAGMALTAAVRCHRVAISRIASASRPPVLLVVASACVVFAPIVHRSSVDLVSATGVRGPPIAS